ncbi:MAG: glutamate racemase [Spirochaetia bacterium]|nr:glutamate racemase [Spirochaetia bacterium]
MADNRAIGIFDSGLGGLTVLAAIKKKFPNENLIYFGDTARVPYGSKSRETVIRYSLEIQDFLVEQNVKMIVVACNTASSHALDEMRKKYDIPVLGVVEPGVMALTKQQQILEQKIEKAAVIATRSTIKSGSYDAALKKINPEVYLYSKACPLLVPLIEEGFTDRKATEMILREYLDEIIREDIHYIILGCTHYPLLKGMMQRLYPSITLIDSSVETATMMEGLLNVNGLKNESTNNGFIKLFVSDITDSLLDMEKLFFGGTIDSVEKVSLGW